MIPILEWRSYWNQYQQRVTGITRIIQVAKEEDLDQEAKNMGLDEIFLAVIIPSFDSQSPDPDNFLEDATCLLYILQRLDRKNMDQDTLANALDATGLILRKIRKCMMDDKSIDYDGGTLMRFLNLNNIHTDPEYNYLGCYGWSMSFMMQDTNFLE